MKKNILILTVIGIIGIPQIASASWWNIFTWKPFKKIPEHKIENRRIATTTPIESSELFNQKAEIEKLKKEMDELRRQTTKETGNNSITPTKLLKTLPDTTKIITTPIAPSVGDKDVLYTNIVKEYEEFKSKISIERNNLSGSTLPLEKQYFSYLGELLSKIVSDIGYLASIKSWNPRPDVNEIYALKLDKLKNDYYSTSKSFSVDIQIEKSNKIEIIESVRDEINLSKQNNLKIINQKIADLNTKYATDIKSLDSKGLTESGKSSLINYLNSKYLSDYNLLKAEWQKVYYSN